MGQRDAYRAQLQSLQSLSYEQGDTSSQIAEAEEGLKAAEKQLAESERDRAKLRLEAPKSGTVLPPTLVPEADGRRSAADLVRLAAETGEPRRDAADGHQAL